MSGTARMTGISHGTGEDQPLIFYDKNGRVFPKTRTRRKSKGKGKGVVARAAVIKTARASDKIKE